MTLRGMGSVVWVTFGRYWVAFEVVFVGFGA